MQKLKVIVASFLRRLIQRLHNTPNPTLIMRILRIIPVQIGHSLFCCVFDVDPVFDEIADVLYVHELDVVEVAVLLAADGDGGGHALIAHGFGVGLVVLAGVVHFVADGSGRQAVVAFYLGRVHGLAL